MSNTPVLLAAGIAGLAVLALMLAAVVSVANSRSYTPGIKALWVLAVLAFPILGSLAWFAIGRHSHG